jgi:hypothetical protein
MVLRSSRERRVLAAAIVTVAAVLVAATARTLTFRRSEPPAQIATDRPVPLPSAGIETGKAIEAITSQPESPEQAPSRQQVVVRQDANRVPYYSLIVHVVGPHGESVPARVELRDGDKIVESHVSDRFGISEFRVTLDRDHDLCVSEYPDTYLPPDGHYSIIGDPKRTFHVRLDAEAQPVDEIRLSMRLAATIEGYVLGEDWEGIEGLSVSATLNRRAADLPRCSVRDLTCVTYRALL